LEISCNEIDVEREIERAEGRRGKRAEDALAGALGHRVSRVLRSARCHYSDAATTGRFRQVLADTASDREAFVSSWRSHSADRSRHVPLVSLLVKHAALLLVDLVLEPSALLGGLRLEPGSVRKVLALEDLHGRRTKTGVTIALLWVIVREETGR
jgi:hypothetical protein